MGYYSSMILLIPAFIFAMIAQSMVKSNYRRFSKIANSRGYTGNQVASMILKRKGILYVRVNPVGGVLTDHYDPRNKTVNLSEGVYGSKSLSALAIAAHECGHAIQHDEDYPYLTIRSAILPAVNFANNTAMPLAFIGILLGAFSRTGGNIGHFILQVAIIMFAIVVLFHVLTLPVEINASRRALNILESDGYLADDEIRGAKKVLKAAAMTYVASAAVALSNLIRFILIARGSRR